MFDENVPPLTNNQILNRQQADFYQRCVKAWESGSTPDIKNQYGYVLHYIHSLVLEPPFEKLLEHLIALKTAYSHPGDNETFFFLHLWISDCYILFERYDDALMAFPAPVIGKRASTNTDCLLSLKVATNQQICGREILTLYGAQLTSFGKKHIDQIEAYLDTLISVFERENDTNLLKVWANTSSNYTYQVFRGSSYGYSATKRHQLRCYSFSLNKDTQAFVKRISRDAENTVREEIGIPYIGEGWISETELYYTIKNEFPDLQVMHHASPDWLGGQHLDIFIPAISLAIEYQGRQHDEPVAFFGGQEAYEHVKKRDARKKRLCSRHHIRIIYVRPGDDINDVLAEVQTYIRDASKSE